MSQEETIVIGYIGIDSGTIAIADPVYLDKISEAVYKELNELTGEEFNARHACRKWMTLEDGSTTFEKAITGATIDTGIGDGFYPVLVTTEDIPGWGRRVTRLEIIFLETEDEDEDIEDELVTAIVD